MTYFKKKILNIIQCSELGGMEMANLDLIKGLIDKGAKISYLSLNPIGKLKQLLDQLDIKYKGVKYKGKYGIFSFFKIFKYINQDRFDTIILTGHNLLATLIIGIIKSNNKILTIHYHHFENSKKGFLKWKLYYFLCNKIFDHIIFPCEYIKEEAIFSYQNIKKKSHVIYYGFDIYDPPNEFEKLGYRNKLGLPKKSFIIGNAGWLIKRKRFDVFLNIAKKLLAYHSNIFFVIAGDGPERENLLSQINTFMINENVKFLGWQSDLLPFYRSIDLLLFNSDFDALGRTPIEAACHNVPVVASVANGGLKEFFSNKNQAMVISDHNEELLLNEIKKIMFHSTYKINKNRNASNRISLFSKENYINNYLRIIRSC
tara:strand:- start:13 stop:1128 length:1116 start_codon:yes stop_codon:yes gene_type:complete